MAPKRKVQTGLAILTLLLLSLFNPAPPTRAQPLLVLHPFSALDSTSHNLDGAGPSSGVVAIGDTLYGVTCCGGQFDFGIQLGEGTIYALNRDGGDFRVLHQFEASPQDGGRPFGLIASTDGNLLFGTVNYAGDAFLGGIYSIQTDGSNFTLLHAFAGEDGDSQCQLALIGDTLFGVNIRGSTSNGAIYSIKTNGSNFQVIYKFTPFDDPNILTNSDGAYPIRSGLAIENNVLYGATAAGGKTGKGTLFQLNSDGSGFTVLRDSGLSQLDRMIVSSGVLYGSTVGVNASGTVFSLKTDGSNFRTLHTFPAAGSPPNAFPRGLLVSGDKLYGAIFIRYSLSGSGSLFRMNLDGTGYQVLSTLSPLNQQSQNTNGAYPDDGVIRIDNELYFAAAQAGPFGSGTVDRLDLQISPATLAIEKTQDTIRLKLYGDLAATYILEDTDFLPTNTWRHPQNIVITENPINIDLPNATAPTYWRARVLER